MNARQWLREALGAALVLALLVGFVTWAPLGGDAGAATRKAPRVVYEVDGTSYKGDLSMLTPTGSIVQDDIPLPLRNRNGTLGLRFAKPAATFARGDALYLSVQNAGNWGTTVTCRITVDGRVISRNSVQGQYAIATCRGRA